ncbi:MAG: serpin family protein [Myxococcales bacterium]
MTRFATPLAVLAALALALACGPTPEPGGDAGPIGPSNCAAPPAADAGTVSALSAGNGRFAIDLFNQLASQADGGNVFASPFSVSAAFGMVYAGAAGTTAQQIGQVFDFPAAAPDLAPAFGALDCQLEADGAGPDGGQLDIANGLFGEKTLPFEPAFLSLLQDDYGAPLEKVDFAGDSNGAMQTINQWVSQNTASMIPHLLQPGDLDPSTLLVLADAVYFHGLWQTPFDPNETNPAAFQVTAQQSVQVPTMAEAVAAPYLKGSGFAMIELPYQSRTAMDILLPDATDGLPQLEAQLTAQNLQSWLSQLAQPPGPISVELPKFSVDVRGDLAQPLQALGLTAPFVAADFSGIDGARDISISKVIHEAVLRVEEAGTEAAAATAVVMTGTAAPEFFTTFDVNHPFLLVIRDLPTGTILFVGQITDPTAG